MLDVTETIPAKALLMRSFSLWGGDAEEDRGEHEEAGGE